MTEIDYTVKNRQGKEINFEATVNVMDKEIRDDMHQNYEPGFDNPQAFIEEYARRHEDKFNEEFVPYEGGAW